jgi:replication factor C subunit 1
VLTGTFETISRDNLGKFIEEKGGFNKQGVSGKTNYLIIGNKLEDGREV